MKKIIALCITSVIGFTFLNSFSLNAQNIQAAKKRVLIEQITQTSNGQSPAGLIAMDQIKKSLGDDAIFVNIHKSDNPNLFTFDGNYIMDAFGSTIPCGIIDRRKWDGSSTVSIPPNEWKSHIATQMNESPKVDIQITNIGVNGLDVTIKVDITFLTDIFGDIRISCLVVENYVHGAGKDFYQVNNFNNITGNPFYGLGDTIKNYEHQRVLKSYFTATWGDWIDIDSNNSAGHYWSQGTTRSYTFSRQVFTNINQMYAVAFVNQYDDNDTMNRPVFNVVEKKLNNVGIEETEIIPSELNIYPNPISDLGRVEFSLEKTSFVNVRIINVFGQIVEQSKGRYYPEGENNYYINASELPAGTYIVQMEIDGKLVSKMFIK